MDYYYRIRYLFRWFLIKLFLKFNIAIVVIVVIAALVNNHIISSFKIIFFQHYFNDVICGAGFTAYSNILLSKLNSPNYLLIKWWQITIFLLFWGVFWEYIAPLFAKDSTSDWRDIVAYLAGGVIYFMLYKLIFKIPPESYKRHHY